MSLVLGGCCREIISNGFHQANNKRSLMMISSSIEKNQNQNQNQNHHHHHLSCFSVNPTDLSSSSSSSSSCSDKSSIGDDTDDDEDDEFTSSNVKFSMDSLEESLPIKRGLSNYFSGRSKSFANLSEATTVKSLAKTENPFNKRRRTLIACRRRSSSSSSRNRESIFSPVSMPLLKLNEDEEETETETDDDDQQVKMKNNSNNTNGDGDGDEEEVELAATDGIQHENGRIKRFKAPRCFSLTDLHHHHHSPPITKNV